MSRGNYSNVLAELLRKENTEQRKVSSVCCCLAGVLIFGVKSSGLGM